MPPLPVSIGRSFPIGATVEPDGVKFCFTCQPNSGQESARRGAYASLIEKIPYL